MNIPEIARLSRFSLLGVIGMNSAVGPVGVAKAAGATSRYIGFSCAAILVIFALIPKYAALFLIMPQPVIGALMVFTASFMIAGGIQIIVSRSIDSRATYVVGVSLLLGLSREIFPTYFERAVPLVHQFTGSMMSIGVLSAFLLNLCESAFVAQMSHEIWFDTSPFVV